MKITPAGAVTEYPRNLRTGSFTTAITAGPATRTRRWTRSKRKYAAVVASGRSDYPNQINNVLAFPGVFRGLLDARASEVTIDMLLRAAHAIAAVVTDEELHASFIIPSVFHPDVPGAVAAAVRGEGTGQKA